MNGKWSAWARVSVLVMAVLMIGGTVGANPPGETRDPDVGKMLFKFNVIVRPNSWGSQPVDGCDNSGHRIFFNETAGTLGTITWLFNVGASPDFQITDCNGTDGDATVIQDEGIRVWIAVRLHGPATAQVRLQCQEITVDVNDNDLCVITSINLEKSKSFTKVATNLVDNANEGILFTLDQATDFKIMEWRVYERL